MLRFCRRTSKKTWAVSKQDGRVAFFQDGDCLLRFIKRETPKPYDKPYPKPNLNPNHSINSKPYTITRMDWKRRLNTDIYLSGLLAVMLLTESMRGKLKLTNMRVMLMRNNADHTNASRRTCHMIRMVCYEFLCWSLLLVGFCLF